MRAKTNTLTKLRLLWTLWRIWRKHPSLRLGQLIDNAAFNAGFTYADNRLKTDLFYIPDERLRDALLVYGRRARLLAKL